MHTLNAERVSAVRTYLERRYVDYLKMCPRRTNTVHSDSRPVEEQKTIAEQHTSSRLIRSRRPTTCRVFHAVVPVVRSPTDQTETVDTDVPLLSRRRKRSCLTRRGRMPRSGPVVLSLVRSGNRARSLERVTYRMHIRRRGSVQGSLCAESVDRRISLHTRKASCSALEADLLNAVGGNWDGLSKYASSGQGRPMTKIIIPCKGTMLKTERNDISSS